MYRCGIGVGELGEKGKRKKHVLRATPRLSPQLLVTLNADEQAERNATQPTNIIRPTHQKQQQIIAQIISTCLPFVRFSAPVGWNSITHIAKLLIYILLQQQQPQRIWRQTARQSSSSTKRLRQLQDLPALLLGRKRRRRKGIRTWGHSLPSPRSARYTPSTTGGRSARTPCCRLLLHKAQTTHALRHALVQTTTPVTAAGCSTHGSRT